MKDKYKIPRKRRAVRKTRGLVSLVKKEVAAYEKKEVELKFFPASVPLQFFYGGSAGTIMQHLTAITQNITDSDRVGDKVFIKSLEFEAILFNSTGVNANMYNDVRIIIFQYNATDMNPVPAQMFITNNVLGAGAVNSAYSARNIDYLRVYHKLIDRTYHIEQGVPAALNYGTTGILTKHVKFKVPLKYCKKRLEFQAGTTNTNNGLWVCVIGSSATAGANPTIGMKWEVHYTDA